MAGEKHTPAPWDWMWVSANASGGGHLYLIDSSDRKIAALWGGAEEKVANARLIAHAPELLTALEDCIKRLRRCSEFAGNAPFAVDALCEQFEAVAAKAKGETA